MILGIDPGTTAVGYALIKKGPLPKMKTAGLFPITSRHRPGRLLELHQALKDLIDRQRPAVMALEKLFFAKNAKTALAVSEARGVILLTAALAGLKVLEYTPLEIKKALTGYGNADKLQVEKMVRLTLKEARGLKARDDVFDAIAVALTCLFRDERHRY